MKGRARATVLATSLVVMASIGAILHDERGGTAYRCQVDGERFRYRAGARLPDAPVKNMTFELTTHPLRRSFSISGPDALENFRGRNIVLDAARSTPVEPFYVRDEIDDVSRQRTRASLLLNNVSGDLRLNHRRWTPPDGWQDSDLDVFAGHCRPLAAYQE